MEARMVVDSNIDVLRKSLANSIRDASFKALKKKGFFNLAVAGGSLIQHLGICGIGQLDLDYKNWTIYLVDERLVPLDHKDSNYGALLKMIKETASVLSQCKIVPVQTDQSVEEAAKRYGDLLPKECLDLVLFGMGPDGHIASLFPGQFNHADTRACVPVTNSPKPPPIRVSLSLQYIQKCKEYVFIITGAEKKDAMTKILKGAQELPASHLDPSRSLWLVESVCL